MGFLLIGRLIVITFRAQMLRNLFERASQLRDDWPGTHIATGIVKQREAEYMWYMVGIHDSFGIPYDRFLKFLESDIWRMYLLNDNSGYIEDSYGAWHHYSMT